MTDTIKKYLKKKFHSKEELDVALKECGVPKRVEYSARVLNTLEEYPCLKELGCVGRFQGFVFESDKFNEVFGRDIFSSLDRVSSFVINVVLDILIKQREAEA